MGIIVFHYGNNSRSIGLTLVTIPGHEEFRPDPMGIVDSYEVAL